MSDPESNRSPRVYKILLMILPVGVVIGTIIFMFMYFYMEREEERNQGVIVSHGLRLSDLQDTVDKFTDRIGERKIETEQGRDGLRRAASMIEGRLGPQNLGLKVTKSKGQAAHGLLWKSLSIDIRGKVNPEEVLFAAVSYAGKGLVADANTVSTLMVLAQSVAKKNPDRTIRFVFLPTSGTSVQQNQWLMERCLNEGESCAGIIGLMVMTASPQTGDSAWLATTPGAADAAWWKYLSLDQTPGRFVDGSPPSIWLTHPVFSADTWAGKQDERLARTLEVARELQTWVMKAAEVQ